MLVSHADPLQKEKRRVKLNYDIAPFQDYQKKSFLAKQIYSTGFAVECFNKSISLDFPLLAIKTNSRTHPFTL